MDGELTQAIARAHDLVARARRVTVLTGAGVSTRSGIPDFRGADGEWTREPDAELVSVLSAYLGDDAIRRRAWQRRADSPVWQARPNAAHDAIVTLERQGKLRALVTQNTDGLHQLAGSDPRLVLEVHGNERITRCEDCGAESPTIEVIERVRAGEADPRCDACGGVLRVTTVLFEEALPGDVIDAAIEAAANCDVLLALGTTLTVYPVAGIVPLAEKCAADIVICNLDPTPYDALASVVVRGDVTHTLPLIVG